MPEDIFKLNFITTILNLPYLLISFYLFYYFYTYKNNKAKRDDVFEITPLAFTSYFSVLFILILNMSTSNFSYYGNLLNHPFKIMTLVILTVVIYVILDMSLYLFDHMKPSLKLFIVLNIFIVSLMLTDSLLFNIIIMIFITILLILTSIFYSTDYFNDKDRYMKITFATFFTLFPLILSLLLLNMDIIKFNLLTSGMYNGNFTLGIVIIQIIILLWNLIVTMFSLFKINVYTVIIEVSILILHRIKN